MSRYNIIKPKISFCWKGKNRPGNGSKFFLVGVLLLMATYTNAQTVYYVKQASGNDASAGTSWGTAFRNLTRAVAAANASSSAVVSIWVAAGTYSPLDGLPVLPSDYGDTSFTFYRGNGVAKSLKLYGGFRGNETTVGGRDTLHPTYLDGIAGSTNSYHIIVIAGLAPGADSVVVDGFTVQNGMAAGSGFKNYNGVSVSRNAGGGFAIVNNSSAKVAITNCRIIGNEAQGVDSSCVSAIGGDGYGGGVYNVGSPTFFYNCSLFGNIAFGNSGGCTTGVLSSGGIGGRGMGGGMYLDSSAAFIERCDFRSNSANGGDVIASSVPYTVGSGMGGGIYVRNCSPVFLTDSFIDNLVTFGNSASAWPESVCYGGGMYNDHASPHMAHCSFVHNKTGVQNPWISTGVFYGGGIYNTHSDPVFDTCDILSNKATSGVGSSLDSALGGGMYNAYSNPILTNCVVAYNEGQASGYSNGGGIYNYHSSPVIKTSSIAYNKVGSGNMYYNSGSGGGVYSTYLSRPAFYSSDITNNSSMVRGGGLCNENHSAAVLVNCNVNNNTAGLEGGGIVNDSSSIDLYRCSVNNNVASAYSAAGGGMLNRASYSKIVRCWLQGDSSALGGGIANYQSYSEIDSTGFNQNVGGAIYQEDSELSVSHSLFYNNGTTWWGNSGGAIYFRQQYGAMASFKGDANFFLWNWAYGDGGAISLSLGNAGKDTMTNNLFAYNVALDAGGALALIGAKHLIYNNTFFKDSSNNYGGGMLFSGTGVNARVANNIFYKNWSAGTSSDTGFLSTGIFVFSHNSYSNSNPRFRNDALPEGANGIWGDDDDGLILQSCSPLRNAGNNLFTFPYEKLDVAGAPRIEGAAIDLGAYETNPVGIISGRSVLCAGTTSTLADTSAGGAWTSSNTGVATVTSLGVVTGVTGGTAIITYTKVYSCGPASDTMLINVETNASVIGGTFVICRETATALTDSAAGGIWTSGASSVATVSRTGIVHGLTPGTSIITYALANSCGLSSGTQLVTVQRGVSVISGADSGCAGTTSVLTDSVAGGMWTSGSTSVAAISTGGSVTGIGAGTSLITYTLTNSCGTTSTTTTYHVHQPAAAIAGADSVCVSLSTLLGDATAGGSWTSGSTAIASISNSGVVIGVSPGIAVITYAVSNYCGATQSMLPIKVEAVAAAITGNDTVCEGRTITLDDVSAGGAWSVSNSALATVTGGVVSGIGAGKPTISYTLVNACGTTHATHNITVLSAYDCATRAIASGSISAGEIEVFPNPATQTIRIAAAAPVNLTIATVTGKVMIQQNNAQQINISELPAGIYLVTIFDQQGVRIKEVRLVKE